MQDDSMADYDRMKKDLKAGTDAKWWRRLLLLPKLIFNAVIVCFYLFLAVLVFFLVQHTFTGETPSVFGHRMYIVQSGSMSPAFHKGSLIFVHPLDPQNIAVGDIITYRDTSGEGEILTTHRVARVFEGVNGLSFATRGDANGMNDPFVVPAGNVVGKVRYYLPAVGDLVSFVWTRTGLLTLIVFPSILLIIFELRSLFRMAAQKKKRLAAVQRIDTTGESGPKAGDELLNTAAEAEMETEMEMGETPSRPAQVITLPAKAKKKKVNGRSARLPKEGTKTGMKNRKNILLHRQEYAGPFPNHNHRQRAAIVKFVRKTTARRDMGSIMRSPLRSASRSVLRIAEKSSSGKNPLQNNSL